MSEIIDRRSTSSSFLFAVLILLLFSVSHSVKDHDRIKNALNGSLLGRASDELVLAAYRRIRNDLEINVDLLTSGIASKLEEILSEVNVSQRCGQSLRDLFYAAARKETWAFKALNAWGNFPPSGLMSGTVTSFGAYDQCIEIERTNSTFHPRYCTILFRPLLPKRPRFHRIVDKLKLFQRLNLNENQSIDYLAEKAHFFYYTPIRVGICLPSECGLEEVDKLARSVGNKVLLRGEASQCESKESLEVEFTTHRKVAVGIISTILLMTLLGTFTELLQDTDFQPRSRAVQILTAFSIKKNLVSLFTGGSSNAELRCLNGIRCLSMSWIILGHTSLWVHHQAFSNSHRIIEVITPFTSQALLNVSLSVETFFLISGLLTSYVTWKTTDYQRQKFDAFWFILSRYARLTPAMGCSICLLFFIPYLGSGPIWKEVIDPIVKGCEKNWWTNLIYMQAYVNPKEICLLPTWWLSNDMIFHLVSLLVLIPLMKSPRIGFLVNLLVILAFAIATAILSATHDYPPAIIPTATQIEEYWTEYVIQFFWRPYLHGPPFFIGLYLGYLLAERNFIKISTIHVVFWWTASLSTLYFVLHAPYPLTMGEEWSKAVSVLFDSTNRILWSLSLAWIIYASAAGYGGLFYDILSHRIFAPFAKITYCVYLTHMFFIWIYMGTRRELIHTSSYNGIYMFLPHWLLAQFLGIICAALFEAPFLNIQKLMASHHRKMRADENIALKAVMEKSEHENGKAQQEMVPL